MKTDKDCIFCKIVAGELPATVVYETGTILAFLDIGPIVKGHTLVIPREHHESIHDIPLPLLQEVTAAAQQVAHAQVAVLDADGINLTQANGAVAGQVVPHFHMHVIPRFSTDGHTWNWNAKEYDNEDEMAGYAQRIRAAIA